MKTLFTAPPPSQRPKSSLVRSSMKSVSSALFGWTRRASSSNYRMFGACKRASLGIKFQRVAGLLSLVLLVGFRAHAGSVPALTEPLALRAIIGEAANQGQQGMLAVACALRNRGSLQGVYGLNNPVVMKQPAWVWEHARLAWSESATHDITGGATHWENVGAFGRPYWTKDMVETVVIKDHRFYKPKVKAHGHKPKRPGTGHRIATPKSVLEG
jgi:hypothetical protein